MEEQRKMNLSISFGTHQKTGRVVRCFWRHQIPHIALLDTLFEAMQDAWEDHCAGHAWTESITDADGTRYDNAAILEYFHVHRDTFEEM